MTEDRRTQMVPVGGVVAVLKDLDYKLIDHTVRSWVFRSKNPNAYAFALPTTRTSVPVEMVRHALRAEPVDVNHVVEQAISKHERGEAEQYQDYDDSPFVFDLDLALRQMAAASPPAKRTQDDLEKTPHTPANRTPEQIAKEMEFIQKIRKESQEIADEDRINFSGNLKHYLYEDF